MRVLWILGLILGLALFVSAQTATLSGTIYDAKGAVIVGAKIGAVTLINERLQLFETTTNDSGEYKLELLFRQYDSKDSFKAAEYILQVEADGFEKFQLKGFKFVPSTKGRMNLDFALDIKPIVVTIKVDSSKKKTNKKENKQ